MGSQATVVLYGLALVAVVVTVDLWFFRNHPGERLFANLGIVAIFGVSWTFLKRP